MAVIEIRDEDILTFGVNGKHVATSWEVYDRADLIDGHYEIPSDAILLFSSLNDYTNVKSIEATLINTDGTYAEPNNTYVKATLIFRYCGDNRELVSFISPCNAIN